MKPRHGAERPVVMGDLLGACRLRKSDHHRSGPPGAAWRGQVSVKTEFGGSHGQGQGHQEEAAKAKAGQMTTDRRSPGRH